MSLTFWEFAFVRIKRTFLSEEHAKTSEEKRNERDFLMTEIKMKQHTNLRNISNFNLLLAQIYMIRQYASASY